MARTINELLPGVSEHIVMRDITSFQVGGVADYYFEAKSVEQLVNALKAAINLRIPYFVMGNASNILFSDYGFPGLVIKNKANNISFIREKSQAVVDAGVMLPRLITESVSNDLAGLEFLYGVPGTIGGATYSNAGAHGSSIGDYIKNLTLLKMDPRDGQPKVIQVDGSWMDFGYRTSKLKKIKSKNKPIILTVKFQFSRIPKEELLRRLKKFQDFRSAKQPGGYSAGSIFKNPLPESLTNVTGMGTKGMPEFPKQRTAGYLLDKAGAKKIKYPYVEVSPVHANFIISKKGARANEIRSVIEEMRDKVRQKFGITLEEEIEYVGQW
jgi:UDP-N-acetylmuramate dehydrogenase